MIGDSISEIFGGLFAALLEWLFRPIGRLFRWLFRPVVWFLRLLRRPCGWFLHELGRLYTRHYWLRALCVLALTTLLWLFFLGLSFYFLQSSWRLTYHGESATGLVVALDERRDSDGVTYSPVVEYDLNGRAYRLNSGIASYPAAYDVGERVLIRYDPIDPRHAEIKAWWSGPALYIFLCGLMAVVGVMLNFIFMRKIWRGESFAA